MTTTHHIEAIYLVGSLCLATVILAHASMMLSNILTNMATKKKIK